MSLVLLYILFVVGGVILEAVLSRLSFRFAKVKLYKSHFTLGRYLFLLTFPIIGTGLVIYLQGWSLLKIFLIFAMIGPIFEWLVGFSYLQVVGARLWTYRRFTYLGHTSLLAAPLWGMAGVLFCLISQKFI